MLMNIITPTSERIFCVTNVKSNDKLYFLEEENIKEVFKEEYNDIISWAGYATAKNTHVINGLYLEPKAIDELVREERVYEYWFTK